MPRSTHPFKLFAAVLALVMVASVALPAVAHACETLHQRVALAACCTGEGIHTPPEMPCHGAPEDVKVPGEGAPFEHIAACCSSGDLGPVDEVARAEHPEPPQVRIVITAESAWRATAVPDRTAHPPNTETTDARHGVGLHVLFGALLN